MKAPRITQKQVNTGLREDLWRHDRHNPAWEGRSCSVLGGSVYFKQERHTGTKQVLWIVTHYTGVPGSRWASKTCDTLRDAVAWANDNRQSAVDASAAELGEDFMERD